MFTGIVEHLGTVQSLTPRPDGSSLLLITNATPILPDARLGDSISVNGVCLTVTELSSDRDTFTAELAPETLALTNLGELKPGDAVDLERAVGGGTRFGGHYVQGHVDCVAEITSVTEGVEGGVRYRFRPVGKGSEGVSKFVVKKGFVCLDGASLTVTEVGRTEGGGEGWFEVMLVEYTRERIVVAKKGVGEKVNLEVDVMGKYVLESVERTVRGVLEGGAGDEIGEVFIERVARRVAEILKAEGK